VAQAERLKAPVLLAYGGFDQRVSIKNGTALRAALDRLGKKYEWVVYPEEGHGLGDDKNRFDFYRRVELFLRQHLTDPAKLR
jgi:dipeptidyl aminopeptidase/acylaminoacyl peptidase